VSTPLCFSCQARRVYAAGECFGLHKDGRCGGSRVVVAAPETVFICIDCRVPHLGIAFDARNGRGRCDICAARVVERDMGLRLPALAQGGA
jgi:hypothetical protein